MSKNWCVTFILILMELPDFEAPGVINVKANGLIAIEPPCVKYSKCSYVQSREIYFKYKHKKRYLVYSYPISSEYNSITQRFERNFSFEEETPAVILNFSIFEVSHGYQRQESSQFRGMVLLHYPNKSKSKHAGLDMRTVRHIFSTVCDRGYFPPRCHEYCVAQNNTAGHYNCSSNGRKTCLSNWTNPTLNCTVPAPADSCMSNPCLNNGTCRVIDTRIQCQCSEPAYGQHCELCRVYLNDNDECRPLPPTRETVGRVVKYSMGSAYIAIVLSAIFSLAFIIHRQDRHGYEEDSDEEDESESGDMEDSITVFMLTKSAS